MLYLRQYMIVVGIVGEKGAGKGTFVKFFKELYKGKTADIRFSDLLKQTLDLWDIPTTRENLQKIAVVMRDGFNRDSLTHAISQRINNLDADVVLVEGVRWLTDEKMIRSFPKNKMVYITADVKLRYERLKRRNEKVGEGSTPYSQFLKEERAVNETLIPKIGKRADFRIDNNGTFDKLRDQVENFKRQLV